MTKLLLIVILLFMIIVPVTTIGAIVENPIGYIGELIFDIGDSQTINNDIKEMYDIFISSNLGQESISYIDELRKNEDEFYPYKIYIIPSLMIANEQTINLAAQTLKDSGFDKFIDKCYEIRKQASNNNEYISLLKKEPLFNKLQEISNTTLLMYIDGLGNSTELENGIPTSTEDLKLIAQGDLYLGLSNPFVASGYRGQCTWWAWTRTKETTGVLMPTSNAREWSKQTSLNQGKEPQSRSVLALWDNRSDGKQHVIFIEDYKDGIVTFSEGNVGGNGDVEYTEQHFLDLLRYGQMSYQTFYYTRILAYDNYSYIYTK